MAKNRDNRNRVDYTRQTIRLFEDRDRKQRDNIAEVARTFPWVSREYNQVGSSFIKLVNPQFSKLIITFISRYNYLVQKEILSYSDYKKSFRKTFAFIYFFNTILKFSIKHYNLRPSYVKLNTVHILHIYIHVQVGTHAHPKQNHIMMFK